MARPLKEGVDYFPLDVHLDDKFELIEAEFGLKGFAVVVKLLQKIYGGQGYYCEWTNDVALMFGKKLGFAPGDNAVSEIVRASINRGIFDSGLYEKYQVLTSKGIQQRYLEAVNRRKEVEIKRQYLLLNVSDLPNNVHINGIDVNPNPENVDSNSQSKVNKSKSDKKKKETTKRVGGYDAVIADYTDNADFIKAIYAFIEMRKAIKKPLTDNALKLIFGKLDKLADNDASILSDLATMSAILLRI